MWVYEYNLSPVFPLLLVLIILGFYGSINFDHLSMCGINENYKRKMCIFRFTVVVGAAQEQPCGILKISKYVV